VLLWHKDNGLEAMPAVDYIERLEAEVARLRSAASSASSSASTAPAPAPAPPPQRLPPAAAWGHGGASDASPAGGGAAARAEGGRAVPALYGGGAAAAQLQPVRPAEDRNELLEFVRALDPAAVGELTARASPEASAAMEAFVERLMGFGGGRGGNGGNGGGGGLGGGDRDALRRAAAETDASELRQLLFWLLAVGWRLRAMEVQMELERSFD
jgi:hypothetical protein